MATITKSADAPAGDVTLTAGQATFTLNDSTKSYDTKDTALLSAARSGLFFDVKEDEAPVEEGQAPDDPNDPRTHPSADHLSVNASKEAVAAAEANQKAIADVTVIAQNFSPASASQTVAEQLAEQFHVIGTDVAPEVPFSTTETAPAAPTDTAPFSPAPANGGKGSGVTEASAPTTSTGASN